MSLYIGIDPGLKGGIAAIYDQGYEAHIMPATTAETMRLIDYLKNHNTTCIIEQVQVMGKSFGAKAALSYGQKYGELIGILTSLGVKIVEVRPAAWKKGMGLTKREGRQHRAV